LASRLGRSRDLVLSSRSLSLSSRDHGANHRPQKTVTPAALRRLRGLTPLGFSSLQHLPGRGVYITRACLTLLVPLSGFLFTLLAVYSSPTLWHHFSGPSVHGVRPFRVFLPTKSRTSLKALCSLALEYFPNGRTKRQYLDFRALLPSKSRTRDQVLP
jgi:hypothetical protein